MLLSFLGGERRGAQVVGFLRVDEEPILLKCQTKHPDQLIIFDLSLVDGKEIFQELKPGGIILLNTDKEIDGFEGLRMFKIGLIDAARIATSVGFGGTFNMAMLGAHVRLINLIKIEALIEAVKATVPAKVEENVEAVKEAYERVRIYEIGA